MLYTDPAVLWFAVIWILSLLVVTLAAGSFYMGRRYRDPDERP